MARRAKSAGRPERLELPPADAEAVEKARAAHAGMLQRLGQIRMAYLHEEQMAADAARSLGQQLNEIVESAGRRNLADFVPGEWSFDLRAKVFTRGR